MTRSENLKVDHGIILTSEEFSDTMLAFSLAIEKAPQESVFRARWIVLKKKFTERWQQVALHEVQRG